MNAARRRAIDVPGICDFPRNSSGSNVLRDRSKSSNPCVALQADVRYGQWQFGHPLHAWTSKIVPVEIIHRTPKVKRTYQIDLLVRDIYFKVYVDGEWMFSRVMPEPAKGGDISLLVEDGSARFENLQTRTLELIAHPFRE
jgi:hypothetical protein